MSEKLKELLNQKKELEKQIAQEKKASNIDPKKILVSALKGKVLKITSVDSYSVNLEVKDANIAKLVPQPPVDESDEDAYDEYYEAIYEWEDGVYNQDYTLSYYDGNISVNVAHAKLPKVAKQLGFTVGKATKGALKVLKDYAKTYETQAKQTKDLLKKYS